jgi:hypothetical protein
MQSLDTTRFSDAAFCDWFYGEFFIGDDRILFARRTARLATRALQVRHDQHAATIKSPDGLANRTTAHLVKVNTKIRLRADPQARAEALDNLNAPILQRRRMRPCKPSSRI